MIILSFFLSFLLNSDETLKDGIDAIIDAQKCNWRSVKSIVDVVTNSLDIKLRKLYVVRPDGFWDKQRLENCAKTQKHKDVCQQIYLHF